RSDGLLRSGNISTGCGNSAGETAVTVVPVREDVNELRSRVYSPPCITARRGGCVSRKYCEAAETDAAGVVFLCVLNRKTTPASLTFGCCAAFLNRSATPPCGDARRGITLNCNCSHLRDRRYSKTDQL